MIGGFSDEYDIIYELDETSLLNVDIDAKKQLIHSKNAYIVNIYVYIYIYIYIY